MDKQQIDYCDMMVLPCGGVAYYDEPNFGANYYCGQCEALLGSEEQPRACKDEEAKWDLIRKLGGRGWDYFKDVEEWD